MTLGNLLSADAILPEMQATERYAAIAELVALLVERGQIGPDDRETVLAALRAREETMSTGIGFGIAIPHASSDRVSKVVAAFGRSSQGIEFEALDNAPVRLVAQPKAIVCGPGPQDVRWGSDGSVDPPTSPIV